MDACATFFASKLNALSGLTVGTHVNTTQNQEYEPAPMSECRVFLTNRVLPIVMRGAEKHCLFL